MRKICFAVLFAIVLSTLCCCAVTDDATKSYHVTVKEKEALYEPLQDSYEPGEKVTVKIINITDTNIHLLINGEKLSQIYRNDIYVKFEFTMPERDVEIEVVLTNAYDPDL